MNVKNKKQNNFIDMIKENAFIKKLIIIGLAFLVLGIFFYSIFIEKTPENHNLTDVENYVEYLEDKLENTLKKVEGVGDVSVVITVSSGKETVLASTIKTSNENGVLITEESPVIINGKTVVLKENYPEITGVLIVAGGGNDIGVKYRLQTATASLLKIGIDKIEILSMK